MGGKEKCEYLKKLRKEIANRNGIDYNPTSCSNDGPCMGTCPVCEKEAAELMAELRKKENSGDLINADAESLSLIKKPSLTNVEDSDDVRLDLSSVDMSSDFFEMTPGIFDVTMGDIVKDSEIIDSESDFMFNLQDIVPDMPDFDYIEDTEFLDRKGNEESDVKP